MKLPYESRDCDGTKSLQGRAHAIRSAISGGFTIVELLVVIVVIGILAALVLNTISGIQDRAYAAQAAVAADAYEKIFEVYKLDHGHYPYLYSDGACLGLSEHYPAKDGFASGVCETWGSDIVSVNESLNSELEDYSNKLPEATLPVRTDDVVDLRSRGMVYAFGWYEQNDGDEIWRPYLSYLNKGDQQCARGEVFYYDDEDVTYCYVWLGNPEAPNDEYFEI